MDRGELECCGTCGRYTFCEDAYSWNDPPCGMWCDIPEELVLDSKYKSILAIENKIIYLEKRYSWFRRLMIGWLCGATIINRKKK